MKWDALEEEPCSLARTVAVIGDRWTLMILRECFLRKRRFDAFQTSLGITRHLLADRLKKLVRFGVLRRIPYMDSPKRYEYILTQKGLDLYPIIMSVVHWGNVHMVDSRGRPEGSSRSGEEVFPYDSEVRVSAIEHVVHSRKHLEALRGEKTAVEIEHRVARNLAVRILVVLVATSV